MWTTSDAGVFPALREKGEGIRSMKGLRTWGAVLLLLNSIVLLVPAVSAALSAVTGGRPWVQTLLGVVGIVVGVAIFAGERGQKS